MTSILLIGGSPSVNSRTNVIVDTVAVWLRDAHHHVDTIEVRTLPPDVLLAADFAHAAYQEAIQRVQDADIIVLVSPVYKAIYSGVLKAFIDLWPQESLRGKRLWAIATGASPAHHRSFDNAVRLLGAELRADHVHATSFVLDKHVERDAAQRGIVNTDTRNQLRNHARLVLAHGIDESAHHVLSSSTR